MAERRLTLIRHAKASSGYEPGLRDFDRPLAPRGEHEAIRMGARLARAELRPDRLVVSTARRAQQTADVIAAAIGYPRERIERTDDLYMASHLELRATVEATGEAVRHLALVGHNPGISLLWGWLTGDDGADLPTCGVARLVLDVASWDSLHEGCARLAGFDSPSRADPDDTEADLA